MQSPLEIPAVAKALANRSERPTRDVSPPDLLSAQATQVLLVLGQRFALTRTALPIDDNQPVLGEEFLEAAGASAVDYFQSEPFNLIANSRHVYRQVVLIITFDFRKFLTEDGYIAGPIYELLALSSDSEPLINVTGRRFLRRNAKQAGSDSRYRWQSMLLEQRLFQHCE